MNRINYLLAEATATRADIVSGARPEQLAANEWTTCSTERLARSLKYWMEPL